MEMKGIEPPVAVASRVVEVSLVGELEYAEAVARQEARRLAVLAGEASEALLLLEHPHVFTLGRNASAADVLADPSWLERRGVAVAETSRGGQVTYHGPGQLVGYPIIDLDPDRRDLRRYVRDLQRVLIRTLEEYGVRAEGRSQPEIGVWVGAKKVASIGVHVKRWVTIHGFALNVTTDLGYFQGIVPCGLEQVEMASIESLTGEAVPVGEVAAAVAGHFGAVFEREVRFTPAEGWA